VIGVLGTKREVKVLLAVAEGSEAARRMAAWIEPVAAGQVQRQAQAEADAFLHFSDAL
jgi:hypothetical protein